LSIIIFHHLPSSSIIIHYAAKSSFFEF